MVLKLVLPKGQTSFTRWISNIFAKQCSLRNVHPASYFSLERAQSLLPKNKDPLSIPSLYILCINGEHYVHPDGVYNYIRKYYLRQLRKGRLNIPNTTVE